MHSKSVSLESMTAQVLKPEFSEEAYFGITNQFSSEMIDIVKELREELKTLLGADWSDSSKKTIKIKEELGKGANISKLVKIFDKMGNCIARNCNIEKCYISVFNDLNAHTLPMSFDSSILLDHDKKPIFKRYGENFINKDAIRSNKEIQGQLMKLEDIVINKDGYKFKESAGKIFIINIGIPLITDEVFASTPEDICCILFHEIGHNFQQMLRGTNQMLCDYYIRACLQNMVSAKFYDIVGFIDTCLINSYIKKVLQLVDVSEAARFSVLRMMLSGSVLVKRDGTIVTREDLGEQERTYLTQAIEAARANGNLGKLSLFTRVFSTIGKTFFKILSLIVLPLDAIHRASLQNDLYGSYSEVIKQNKTYEQFADTFAVAYGFGGNSAKFYIELQKYIKNMKTPSYANILNYIPVISTIDAVNTLNRRMMMTNVGGYDQDHVRIAQAYRVLEFELANNKELSKAQIKEIQTHMDIIKADYEEFKKLEMENFRNNPSLTKYLMKKFRSGEISNVASASGIVEGVLEVINEYEKTGVVNEPPIVERIKKDVDGGAVAETKFTDKLITSINSFKDFIISRVSL